MVRPLQQGNVSIMHLLVVIADSCPASRISSSGFLTGTPRRQDSEAMSLSRHQRLKACWVSVQPVLAHCRRNRLFRFGTRKQTLDEPLGEVWTGGFQAYREMERDHQTVIHKERYVSPSESTPETPRSASPSGTLVRPSCTSNEHVRSLASSTTGIFSPKTRFARQLWLAAESRATRLRLFSVPQLGAGVRRTASRHRPMTEFKSNSSDSTVRGPDPLLTISYPESASDVFVDRVVETLAESDHIEPTKLPFESGGGYVLLNEA